MQLASLVEPSSTMGKTVNTCFPQAVPIPPREAIKMRHTFGVDVLGNLMWIAIN
jgi:hypothetical protein